VIVQPQQRIVTPETAFTLDHKNRNAGIDVWDIPSKVGDQELAGEASNLKGICVMRAVGSAAIPCMYDITIASGIINKPEKEKVNL
jgi:hypothetical protein